jgi:hypothetical protein
MKHPDKVVLEEVDISIVDSHIRLKEVTIICMEYLAKIYSDRVDLYRFDNWWSGNKNINYVYE